MDEKSHDKLGFKERMFIFTALEKIYGRECAFDIATKSDDHVLKLVAIAAADEQAAQVLLHDLATLRDKKDGTPAHNALRWQRRVNRALDRALRHAEAGPHHEAAREGARLMRNRSRFIGCKVGLTKRRQRLCKAPSAWRHRSCSRLRSPVALSSQPLPIHRYTRARLSNRFNPIRALGRIEFARPGAHP